MITNTFLTYLQCPLFTFYVISTRSHLCIRQSHVISYIPIFIMRLIVLLVCFVAFAIGLNLFFIFVRLWPPLLLPSLGLPGFASSSS